MAARKPLVLVAGQLKELPSGDYILPGSRNTQTGTSYTLVIGDTWVTMNNASANTVTIPPNSSVAFEVDRSIDFAQLGAGQTTFAPGSGVTLRATPGLKCRAQYSGVTAIKIATDEWLLVGDLTA